jgi:hypothetical protein
MMLPAIKQLWGGRALLVGAGLLATSLVAGAGAEVAHETRAVAPAPAAHVAWTEACEARLERARMQLGRYAGEFGRAEVRTLGARRWARVELTLPPQYSARIEYRLGADDSPAVFDWEETPTPVVGSFALHRHVGAFDLAVIADDSDERGLRFAALMQPLLDGCLMDAR